MLADDADDDAGLDGSDAVEASPSSTSGSMRERSGHGGRRGGPGAQSKRWCSRRPSRCRPPLLAQLLELPTDACRRAVRRSSRPSTSAKGAASSSRASRAGTGSRPIPTRTRTSSASCSRARPRACRAPRSRRSRSSPTSSRSPGAQISAIRGVNVDATLKTFVAPGLHRGERARAHARQPDVVLDHRVHSSSGWARFARAICRRSPTSFRSRASSKRSSGVCVVSTWRSTARATPPTSSRARTGRGRRRIKGGQADDRRTRTTSTRASGCRSCSRGAGFGSRRTCEMMIADGPGRGRRGDRGARGARRIRRPTRIVVDGVPVVVDTTRRVLVVEQAGRIRHDRE